MVKGTSRQVILVRSPEQKLFEQAIFILKENAEGVSDEDLLREARHAIGRPEKKRHFYLYGAFWAGGGAVVTGLVWLLTAFL